MAKATMPAWIEPMAATLTRERFAGPEWVFEQKLDGIRLLAFKKGRDVQLFSRNQLSQNASYPTVVAAIAALPIHDVILDGEALGVFRARDALGFHVFDVPWLAGRDLTALPLDERRAELEKLPLRAPLQVVPRLSDPEPWQRACREGWEGVIAKRCDSRYEQRRSPNWLKMKCEASQELVVGGFTDPQGQRQGIGALLVGYFEGEDFVFAGKVGTGEGFTASQWLKLRAQLDKLTRKTAPFTRGTGLPRANVHWARPEVVVAVSFTEWTNHDKLRHPRLVGVRVDKNARAVVRERA